MSYHVYFGDCTIYGAQTVDVTLARPVTVYNGIGQGEFPIPEDEKLREWVIKGQWTEHDDYGLSGWKPARRLRDSLRSMMGSDDPERLIVSNGSDRTSVPAYLTDLTMTEKYPGVYDYTIKATEYKKATARTTGVPTIERPGKIPEMPKTVVFPTATAVAEDAIKRTLGSGSGYDTSMADFKKMENQANQSAGYYWADENGLLHHTDNPNLVPTGAPVTVEPGFGPPKGVDVPIGYRYNPYTGKMVADETPASKGVRAVFDAMKKANEEYRKQAEASPYGKGF